MQGAGSSGQGLLATHLLAMAWRVPPAQTTSPSPLWGNRKPTHHRIRHRQEKVAYEPNLGALLVPL